jgi:outer membrane receptor protein involved in Fe transport
MHAPLPAFAQEMAAADIAPLIPVMAVTITGTREKRPLAETPASVGVIAEEAIRFTAPTHPQQLLGQVPGVAVAVTNGEGHTTAIRQPFTTGPVYLYLEDGVPTRATGFFNHNALYEVDIPAAARVEVVRGPGTALYGSDAIGGTVNVLTRAPGSTRAASISGEAGSFGWHRLLLDANTPVTDDSALRGQLNLSHSDGWRDGTAYDRQSLNLRWDTGFDGGPLWRTGLGATHIDQQTGANTPLTWDDYRHHPTKNNMAIAFRQVDALRLSSQYEREEGASLWTLTPYLRFNSMELNGSYNLSFDPRIEDTQVHSLGFMAKWRRDFGGALRPRLIAGIDLDHSPGSRREDSLVVTTTGSGADTQYTGYTIGGRIYDYDVRYASASAYVHGEVSPLPELRVTAGLRHDHIGYEMDNRLGIGTTSAGTRVYGQLPEASVSFGHWSPKLGATWSLSPSATLYASYNHGFRTPSESQLFRAGAAGSETDAIAKARLALGLKPIRAQQLELGLRGEASGWNYELAVYDLVKRDDLVSQRDLATNVSTNVNAGRTRHRGLELGLGTAFASAWRVDTAVSWARHTYEDWVTATADYSGKEMESAPHLLANTRLTWTPTDGTTAQLEWTRVGAYWLEASNSAAYGKYPGHDVFNLRVNHRLSGSLSLFGRITNLLDKRYADSASVLSNTAVYAPALPRAFYVGVEGTW